MTYLWGLFLHFAKWSREKKLPETRSEISCGILYMSKTNKNVKKSPKLLFYAWHILIDKEKKVRIVLLLEDRISTKDWLKNILLKFFWFSKYIFVKISLSLQLLISCCHEKCDWVVFCGPWLQYRNALYCSLAPKEVDADMYFKKHWNFCCGSIKMKSSERNKTNNSSFIIHASAVNSISLWKGPQMSRGFYSKSGYTRLLNI